MPTGQYVILTVDSQYDIRNNIVLIFLLISIIIAILCIITASKTVGILPPLVGIMLFRHSVFDILTLASTMY